MPELPGSTSSPAAGLGPPPDLGRFGRLTLAAVVLVGISAALLMNDAPLRARENLGIAALGGLFLLAMVHLGDRLEAMRSGARVGYFLLQLLLVAGIFALQARLGSFGMAWLLLMPLVVQGFFLWRWPGVSALVAAALLLPTLHVLGLAGRAAAVEVLIGIGAGIAFVLLFSAALVREHRARQCSERLGEELSAAGRRLSALAVQAEELAAERERNRLAREIHDSVGHRLTVAHVQIEAARVHAARGAEEADSALEKASEAVRTGLNELRSSLTALRADPLAGAPLPEALEALCRECNGAGIETTFEIAGEPRALPEEAALTLFRAAQEGLTNVQRHSGARRAEVVLDYGLGEVGLQVRDDGRGSGASPGAGFGLLGVRERVALHGGTFAAGPREAPGFELAVEIPA